MADLQEAAQQVQQAQQQLAIEQEKTAQAKAQVEAAAAKNASQVAMRQQNGIAGLQQRQRVEAQVEASRVNIAQREAALKDYSSQVSTVQQQVETAQTQKEAYNLAQDVYLDPSPYAIFRLKGNNLASTYYQRMQIAKNASIADVSKELKEQNVDTGTIGKVQNALLTDLGKVSNVQINSRVNKLIDSRTPDVTEVTKVEPVKPTTETASLYSAGFDLLPSVSAKSINISEGTQGNGFGSVSGPYNGLGVSAPASNNNSNWLTRAFETFKRDISQDKSNLSVSALGGQAVVVQGNPVNPGSGTLTLVPAQKETAMPYADYGISDLIGSVANKVTGAGQTTKLQISTNPNFAGTIEAVPISPNDVVMQATVPNYGYITRGTQQQGQGLFQTRDITRQEAQETRAAIASGALNVGLYSIPYVGSALVFGEAGGSVLSNYAESGNIKSAVFKFAKENPLQAASVGLFGVAGAAKAVSPFFKEDMFFRYQRGLTREVVTADNGMQFVVEYTKPVKTVVKEVRQPIVTPEGKSVVVSKFSIMRSTPETYGESSSPFQRAFFTQERKIVQPARIDVIGNLAKEAKPVVTSGGEIINNPSLFGKRQGAKLFNVFTLRGGSSEELTPSFYKSLSPAQQESLRVVAEAKAGVPVSLENTPLILGKDFKYSAGYVETEKFARVSPGSRTIFLPNYGKRIARAETIGTESLVFDNGNYKIYKTNIQGKEITNPLYARRGGYNIKGATIELKPVDMRPAEESVSIFGWPNEQPKPRALPSTKSSIETLQKVKAAAADLLPRTRSIPTPKASAPTTLENSAPVIGKTAKSAGAFAGQGTYETTSEFASQLPAQKASTIVFGVTTSSARQDIGVSSLNVQVSQLRTQSPQARTFAALKELAATKEGQAVITRLFTASRAAQSQNFTQAQVNKSSMMQSNKSAQSGKLFPSIKAKKKSSNKGVSNIGAFGDLRDAIEVFVRRRGKDILVSEKATIGEASKELIGKLKGTLAASGYLKNKRTGQKLPLSSYAPRTGEFGSAKRDSYRIVQKRGYRISSSGEKVEIRSSQKRRKNAFGLFK